jgi:tetratricopeptide (TPR) repeat protein
MKLPLLLTLLLSGATFSHPAQAVAQTSSPALANLQRAEALVAAGHLSEAEAVYRQLVAREPDSRPARLGLARTLLWQLRHAEARQQFAILLERNERDVEARLGLATLEYWSGDSRRARQQLRRLLVTQPGNEEALRMLSEIESAIRPGWSAGIEAIDDDQPMQTVGTDARAYFFADPLTMIEVGAGSVSLDAGETVFQEQVSVPWAEVSVSSSFPRTRLGAGARIRLQNLPDGRALLWDLNLSRRFSENDVLMLRVDRRPLLRTAAAVVRSPTATVAELRWTHQPPDGWLASAGANRVGYPDDNSGAGVDGYVLAPLVRRSRSIVWAGLSAGYRDTDEARFRLSSVSSVRQPDGLFGYRYTGVYDPYWTPHDLREARLIVASRIETGRATLRLHADYGIAHDEVIAFFPDAGVNPLPALISSQLVPREYNPSRLAVSVELPLTQRIVLQTEFAHDSTPFYTANELRARLGGRF